MQSLKIHYILFFAVFMLMAKPFVGFSVLNQLHQAKSPKIFVKAFTKRKQEYVADSDFDASAIQKRLANPGLPLTVLFSFFLNFLYPSILSRARQVTASLLSDISLSLFPPLHRYLLAGILII